MRSVKLSKVIEKMGLRNLTPDIDVNGIRVTQPDVNRPALQLTGFFDHFDTERIQIVGYVETAYMENLDDERRMKIYNQLLSSNIPCMVFCRDLKPDQELLDIAAHYGVPILTTSNSTSSFMAELIRWLKVQLAPTMTIHGVLVDVYGEGVLIMGESGIGKSEAALELIKRGHRLITDDVVEIHKVSDETLIGTAPEVTKHLIELRGIGIIDVRSLFGIESIKDTQSIDIVIKLKDWSKDAEYDRLGMEEQYTEFLGNKVICHDLPVRPGRNLAVIVETAAVNYRQKKMGYNAAKELYNRVQKNLAKRDEDED